MQEVFINHKKFTRIPMNRLEYNKYRRWELPADEDGSDEGYLVECLDGGKANHPNHEGYISWLPKNQFDESYTLYEKDENVLSKSGTHMTFGQAIHYLKQGFKVAREGWNGKAMFLFLVEGSTFKVNRKPLLGIYPEGTTINYNPHIDMKTADGSIVPWLASQTDVLAEDWLIVH